jgi:hypothetical protein
MVETTNQMIIVVLILTMAIIVNWLVVWNMNFICPCIGKNIPTDFHIFRGVGTPPTS